MKYIALTCAGREEMAEYLKAQIPNLEISYDHFTDAGKFVSTSFYNARQAWEMADDEPCVFLEDDIILCNNFCNVIKTFKI